MASAAQKAMQKRDAARGTPEYGRRQKQVLKFVAGAVKKRQQRDSVERSFKKPDAERTPTMEEYIDEIKIPLRSASKRLPGGAPNKKLGLDFDLSGVPDKRTPKEPEKRPYTKMTHDERVKDNKRIQAAKDAQDPNKKERQAEYQRKLAKNPAVIARKKAIKQGTYSKYGKEIHFADISRKNQDMTDTAKKGYHVNKPREVYDESYISEDDMKGMSVSSGHKRPTKSGAGMTAKGVAAYRRRNPGSKLKTAVTGKVKKGSKDANRRKSYCARSAGQMKKFPKAAKDPNSRLRQARRRWKC